MPTTQEWSFQWFWLAAGGIGEAANMNYRFTSTAALYLGEKYDLSSLLTDSGLFSSGSFWHS